ncbi:hypothetical protein Pmani_026434 [Petrolisthes manimaculis]|uniref:Uncharacterized protein n=1 Tax=Petrolisthes manimaculis TaxID=1843537 RepID=A0AAE1P2T0_9EUCA|nr:hypothetical protein Pmani_027796 [Petrolisthes manimaculis]KAK4301419.1 hypothetical protein Pmani_026434 [Petrolisthes manimaculis]
MSCEDPSTTRPLSLIALLATLRPSGHPALGLNLIFEEPGRLRYEEVDPIVASRWVGLIRDSVVLSSF